MTLLRFHRDDYKESPRRSESSEKVVRYWFDGRVVYDVETAVADEDCLGIIAERIVLRRLLGIDGGEKKHVPYVLDAKPFGGDGPKCAELLLSDVFVAMAFVPLTPPDSRGRPVVARLYCVSGLSNRYSPSSLHADGVPGANRYSWFLTGLPDEKHDAAIDGHSWLLAAELLKHVVTKRDVATVRNLATKYIVTGDVQDGLITKVVMGRKDELALRPAYRDFKWIIPKENDMNNVPKRKLEKPATLDEAYKLIESMQSVATQAMFKFLRYADLEEVKKQYERNGADIFAAEATSGLSPLEVVAQEIEMTYLDTARSAAERDKRVQKLKSAMLWLKQQNTDCAMMFYLLACTDDEGLKLCAERYPINAVDEHGLTAVDWALNSERWDVAKRLHALGGVCNGRFGGNKKLSDAIKRFFSRPYPRDCFRMSDDDLALIVNAVDNGLDPALMVEGPALWMNSKFEWERGSVRASLFGLALETYEIPIVEACLRNGANVKTSRFVAKKIGRQESFCLDESAIGQVERVLKECDERFPLEADDPVFIASEKWHFRHECGLLFAA